MSRQYMIDYRVSHKINPAAMAKQLEISPLLPENHRPGPGYDPNRYALPEEVLSNFTVMPGYVRVWK